MRNYLLLAKNQQIDKKNLVKVTLNQCLEIGTDFFVYLVLDTIPFLLNLHA